jgi:chorismate mutase
MSHTLQGKRNEIDQIDCQLISLLSQRLAICAEIFEIKQQENLAIRDQRREEALIQSLIQSYDQQAITPFIPMIFKGISEACYQYQIQLSEQKKLDISRK